MAQSEQLSLPLGIYSRQEVMWLIGEEVRDWRKLGKKAVMVMTGMPQFESIEVDKIDSMNDPALRYALRFAAAAAAMDFIQDSEFASHSHFVNITATNDGVDSRLLRQSYSGSAQGDIDTFMEDLHRFAPDAHENH